MTPKAPLVNLGRPRGRYAAKVEALYAAGQLLPGMVILRHRGVHPAQINQRTNDLGARLGARTIFVDHQPTCQLARLPGPKAQCDCDAVVTDGGVN